jgi:hypothetical protein
VPNAILRALSLLAVCSLGFAGGAQAADGNHALIIGIGNYAPAFSADPLLGVQHDVRNARRMAAAMGVDPSAIVELRDAQATKERILQELDSLKARVKPGDRVLVYFSGHGTRRETADGCKEGLSSYTGDMVTDEELAAYTQPISRDADKLLVMIDACFSGGVIKNTSRSVLGDGTMRAKFSGLASSACVAPVNQSQTRSLLSELKRLGVKDENFVQIAAANYNEVSWDNKEFGGLATSAVSRCLLGEATDLDGSGGISLEEVRACAQSRMDDLMRPFRQMGMTESTLQVRGNRNLVVAPAPLAEEPARPLPVVAVPPATSVPVVLPSAPGVPVSEPPAVTGARATLEEILQQRDPRRRVEVEAPSALTIGSEPLRFTVRSSADGYLYVLLLGSDEKSFYLLFPNKLDTDNRVVAGRPYAFPHPGWRVVAAGPPGSDRLLFVVSDSPRDPRIFVPDQSSAGGPYTFSVADLSSRRRLIDFLLGRGVKGRNAALGAELISIQETQ